MVTALLLVAAFLAPAVECELPEWRQDTTAVMRDTAEFVLDGTVVGLRYLNDPRGPEIEVLVDVLRAWRRQPKNPERVYLWNAECGPDLLFGHAYVLGIRMFEGKPDIIAAVERNNAKDLMLGLGAGARVPSAARAPYRTLLAATLVAAAVLASVWVRKKRYNSGRP